MRLKLGGAMAEILNSGKLQFKDARAADLFNRRVASYSIDKQGEEALAIVSESYVPVQYTEIVDHIEDALTIASNDENTKLDLSETEFSVNVLGDG